MGGNEIASLPSVARNDRVVATTGLFSFQWIELVEIKRAGLAECAAWLRYGSPEFILRLKGFEPTQPALSQKQYP